MSEKSEKKSVTEEEQANNRFSFIVGMGIALTITILFTIFFNR